jgi:membrane-bound metal-dependent hydrolase YbcI (DUF457 family)
MLTPDDESYKMKAHRVLMHALSSTVFAFFSGVWLGRLFSKGNNLFEIAMLVVMVMCAVLNGWRARLDFKRLVSKIPVPS